MIPKFLTLTDHPSSKIRSHAVACLPYFVHPSSAPVTAALFAHTYDKDSSVRRHVCQAFVFPLTTCSERLMLEMNGVAECML